MAVIRKTMKPPYSSTFAPVIASVALLCSMGLFAMSPRTPRIWQVPEGNNGGLYCKIDPRRTLPVEAFRSGNLAIFGQPIESADLKEVMRPKVEEIHELGMYSLLRLRMDPDIAMVHVRQIYEAAEAAGVDGILIRVRMQER